MNLKERMEALVKFQNRAMHIQNLIEMFDIAVDASGRVIETNTVKLEKFYDQIQIFDNE